MSAPSPLLAAVLAFFAARDALERANTNNLEIGDPRFAAVRETLAELRAIAEREAA